MSNTPTKSHAKARSGGDGDESGSAFKDISGAVEQLEKEAQEPIELDSEGAPVVAEPSEAAVEVADEMARRSAAQAEGGGPWPQDLMRERYVGNAQRMDRGRAVPDEAAEEKPAEQKPAEQKS